MDRYTNAREIADNLFAQVEEVDICEGITKELVERTNDFEELFLLGLSEESFDDELLDISTQQFSDLSKVFFNIREYIRTPQDKYDYVESLEGEVNQHLTCHAISLIETSIRRQEEDSIKTDDAIEFTASQCYL